MTLKINKIFLSAFILVALSGFITGCNGNNSSGKENMADSSGRNAGTLLGAGSTFVYPLFSKQFSEYNKLTGLKINYQSIGSGGGILQLTNKTVDFGDSDAPLTEEQAQKMGVPVLHIPMCSGAVVISYNLPEVKDTLKLNRWYLQIFFLVRSLNGMMQKLQQLITG